jgi:hypothetical protein
MDWTTFQACLEDRLLENSVVNDKETIEKCTEELPVPFKRP